MPSTSASPSPCETLVTMPPSLQMLELALRIARAWSTVQALILRRGSPVRHGLFRTRTTTSTDEVTRSNIWRMLRRPLALVNLREPGVAATARHEDGHTFAGHARS